MWVLMVLLLGAEPAFCDLTHPIEAGEAAPCNNHISVPRDYLAHLKKMEAALLKTEADLRKAQEDAATASEASSGAMAACQRQVDMCEASRVPSVCVCPEPGLFARPSFSWPTGLVLGFLGGVWFDQEVVKR